MLSTNSLLQVYIRSRWEALVSIKLINNHLLTLSIYHLLTFSIYYLLTFSIYHLLTFSIYHLLTFSIYHLLTFSIYHNDVLIFNVENILFLIINYIFLFFKCNFMMRNHFSLFSRVRIKQARLTLSKSLFFIIIRE